MHPTAVYLLQNFEVRKIEIAKSSTYILQSQESEMQTVLFYSWITSQLHVATENTRYTHYSMYIVTIL
jgi:hypothetical protein